jgi:hypothetical protein
MVFSLLYEIANQYIKQITPYQISDYSGEISTLVRTTTYIMDKSRKKKTWVTQVLLIVPIVK